MEEKEGGNDQAAGEETPKSAPVSAVYDKAYATESGQTAGQEAGIARQRSNAGGRSISGPSAKRFKPISTEEHGDTKQHAARGARTPAIVTEPNARAGSSDRQRDDRHVGKRDHSDRRLPPSISRRGSGDSGSLSASSDLSSGSSSNNHRFEARSPVGDSGYAQEVPPAPPSTPASNASARRMEPDLATPLPFCESVRNADRLEQQQLLSEGAVTPAPKHGGRSAGRTLPMSEDFSEWAVGDRYEMIRILGRGSYGEVAQAVDKYAGHPDAYVAIKRILSPFDQEIDAIRLYREIHILRRLKGHNCIINLLDVVQPPTNDLDDFHDLYLVFEYVDTDLYKLIMSPQYLTTEHIQTFLYQMLTGLKYIHSFSVIHRDLKPANILLNEDCSLKICDFGLARIVNVTDDDGAQQKHGNTTSRADVKQPESFGSPPVPRLGLTRQLTKHVVTRWYRAPELILIQPYTAAVDIWSLGCILAELLSMQEGSVPGYQDRKPLFPGGTCYPLSGDLDRIKTEERLDQLSVIFGVIGTPSAEDITSVGDADEYIRSMKKTVGKPLENIFPAADAAAIDLLNQMLQFNPKQRCTAEQALEHDFFKGIRQKELEPAATETLVGPAFLETNNVDLETLKRKTFEEVRWYRDHGSSDQKPPATKEGKTNNGAHMR